MSSDGHCGPQLNRDALYQQSGNHLGSDQCEGRQAYKGIRGYQEAKSAWLVGPRYFVYPCLAAQEWQDNEASGDVQARMRHVMLGERV